MSNEKSRGKSMLALLRGVQENLDEEWIVLIFGWLPILVVIALVHSGAEDVVSPSRSLLFGALLILGNVTLSFVPRKSLRTFILTGFMLESRPVQNSSRALNGMVAPFSELEADVDAMKAAHSQLTCYRQEVLNLAIEQTLKEQFEVGRHIPAFASTKRLLDHQSSRCSPRDVICALISNRLRGTPEPGEYSHVTEKKISRQSRRCFTKGAWLFRQPRRSALQH